MWPCSLSLEKSELWCKQGPPLRLMDSVDVCAATSTADGDGKRRVHKRNRDWLNRLHLRKAALQPPAMQSPDKLGPKKIAAAAAAEASTTWPPSKKRPNHEELQRAIHGGGTSLRFRCSQCTDGVERGPRDLLKHFNEKHEGCPPVFSCHMCKFTTHEFSYLQVHVLSHKDTFSCCCLCRDDVQRSWAEFSAHLAMVHTQNGRYTCEVCKKYSTADDKEFLEHVLLHNLGLDLKGEQARGKTTAYKCQFCGYEASQKVILTKHVKAVHGSVNCKQRNTEAFSMGDLKGKPRMTRSAVKDIRWLTQDCLSLPGREFLDKYCHLSDAKTTLEQTEQFLMKSGKRRWSKALQNVLSNVPRDENHLQPRPENGAVSVSPDSSQDVLTVKNKVNQNGGSFVKRLKLMTEKEVESGDADSCEKIVSDANLSGCLKNQELKPSSEILIVESTEGPALEENRENHRLKTHLNEHGVKEIVQDAVMANDLNADDRKVGRAALPKKKRKNLRWGNMKKKADKSQTALALKIVLKKNPKAGKQWITQSPKKMAMQGRLDAAGEIQDGGRSAEGLVNGTTGKSEGRREGPTEASPSARPVITAHSVPPSVPVDRTQEALPTDSSLRRSSTSDTSPSPPLPLTETPKSLERTLHLVALSPSQLVKRPAGCQPVVVLNHPDADVPEVSRIMEVVKKYKGEVHKVVLSKRTLNAMAGPGPGPAADGPALRSPVLERFLLKLKLRRLSKRKFEVVKGEALARGGGAQTFRCWFCGRVFGRRDVWLSHRQRHLLEWKSPDCENSQWDGAVL